MLPKTNEPGNVTKLSDAAVIDINKSKFDDSIISSEINIVHIDIAHIDNYDTLHCDCNRHGREVGLCIRNDLSYDGNSFFHLELKIFSSKNWNLQTTMKPVYLVILIFTSTLILNFSKK